MGNPAERAADTQKEQDQETKKASNPTFADRVNDVVKEMTQDAKGNWVLPEGIDDEAVRVAAMAEKRYRDTQAALTRISQENKALKAEKSVLRQKATAHVELDLTPEQEAELEDLKFEDPEAWRKKVNFYEQEAKTKHEKALDEEVKKVSSQSLDNEEIERRKTVLSAFLEDHEGFELDDDIIANDIPPRIVKKLETGKISFEDFLQECYDYTKTGKVIKQDKVLNQPNLSKVGGSDRPDKNAVKEDMITSYNKETY